LTSLSFGSNCFVVEMLHATCLYAAGIFSATTEPKLDEIKCTPFKIQNLKFKIHSYICTSTKYFVYENFISNRKAFCKGSR
jgi:hypothetical protein